MNPAPHLKSEIANLKSAQPAAPAPASTELFELAGAAAASRQRAARKGKAKRKKPFAVERQGSVAIPIYRELDRRFMICWYEGSARKRTRRTLEADARAFAQEKARALANGELYMASMTQAQRATLQRVEEILLPTGHSPELAAAVYTQCVQILEGTGLTLLEAARIAKQTRAQIIPISVPAAVAEFLAAREANTFGRKRAGVRWLATLSSQLNRFADDFTCQVADLKSDRLSAWLFALRMKKPGTKDALVPIGGRTIRGYLTALSNFTGFCKARHYLKEDWKDLDLIQVPECDDPLKPVLLPEELDRLLVVAPGKMVPFICLGAFAGIRHEEMNGKKELLDWRNIDFANRVIYVPKGVAKIGDDRIVKLRDNLAEWLLPHRRASGPVCEVANTSNALYRLKKKAGIRAGKNETRNVLRKSWESYSEAVKADLENVHEQAGHSQAVAKRNYVLAQLRTQGERWFAIRPTSADVLPLEFAAR